jgi:hypothetical protein
MLITRADSGSKNDLPKIRCEVAGEAESPSLRTTAQMWGIPKGAWTNAALASRVAVCSAGPKYRTRDLFAALGLAAGDRGPQCRVLGKSVRVGRLRPRPLPAIHLLKTIARLCSSSAHQVGPVQRAPKTGGFDISSAWAVAPSGTKMARKYNISETWNALSL